MSENSTRLGLPYLVSGQAQKHVTVNESLLRLDALVQLTAVSATLAAQPAAPSDGDIYILPAGKSGAAWSSMPDGALAYYRDGVWEQLTPKTGWRCYVTDQNALLVRGANGWFSLGADSDRRLLFTPGGDGVVSIYRIDAARTQNPRVSSIASISSDVITITTPDAGLLFGPMMAGVSYARIWNTSKTPNQQAWVRAAPGVNQLQVVSAPALSGWNSGDTIQIGDPTAITPNRAVALDISPMMQAVLGRVFRQSGVLLKALVQSTAAVQATIDASENGASGSFHGVKSFTDGALQAGQFTMPCSVGSPVSDSNLVFVRESVSATLTVCGVSVVGLWI